MSIRFASGAGSGIATVNVPPPVEVPSGEAEAPAFNRRFSSMSRAATAPGGGERYAGFAWYGR